MAVYNILLFLHLLAVTVWIGGMFVIHVVVRPSAAELLEPPLRLAFLARVLDRFFTWVGAAILLLLASGIGILHLMRGWDQLTVSIYAMAAVGVVMMLVYGHVRYAIYPRLAKAVSNADWAAGAAALGKIRRMVGINLVLGLLTMALATLGRLLG